MGKKVVFVFIFVLVLGLGVGCSRKVKFPPDSIWLVMKNETGEHLTEFLLDHGRGKIRYEVFSRGYTFGEWVVVKEKQVVNGCYFDEQGVRKEFVLERELVPEMVGGTFRVEFGQGGKISLSMDWAE